jgi:PKHD-type hydroxylase
LGAAVIHDWYFVKNAYSKEICEEILTIAKENPSKNYSDRYDNSNKNVNVNTVELNVFGDKLNYFFNLITQINEEVFGFNLFPYNPRTLNFNYYNAQQEYPFHKDSIVGMSDIKLTAILNLSLNSFDGGEFEVFTGGVTRIEEIDKLGSLLVFPSFLYHRVKPVLSGERVTMSCWFSGPNWK